MLRFYAQRSEGDIWSTPALAWGPADEDDHASMFVQIGPWIFGVYWDDDA
jgi:hypothetical protein